MRRMAIRFPGIVVFPGECSPNRISLNRLAKHTGFPLGSSHGDYYSFPVVPSDLYKSNARKAGKKPEQG